MRVDNRRWQVLISYDVSYVLAGICRIAEHVFRRLPVSVPNLREKRSRLLYVVRVSSGYINCDGQFVGGITKDKGLIAKPVLILAFRVPLDPPCSVRVTHFANLRPLSTNTAALLALLVPVAPSLHWRGVDGKYVTEPRQRIIQALCERPLDISTGEQLPALCQSRAEPRERRVA